MLSNECHVIRVSWPCSRLYDYKVLYDIINGRMNRFRRFLHRTIIFFKVYNNSTHFGEVLKAQITPVTSSLFLIMPLIIAFEDVTEIDQLNPKSSANNGHISCASYIWSENKTWWLKNFSIIQYYRYNADYIIVSWLCWYCLEVMR